MIIKSKLQSAILAIGLSLLLSGCELLDYHPYEGRIKGDTHLTDANCKRLERLNLGAQFKFAFISDTQRWYDDTDDAVASINARRDIDFVIHGGDMTDYGITKEFEWMRDCLSHLHMPWLTVIGNHDFQGHGEHIYSEMFGPYNYAFTAGHVRFLMINTVALELDYSTPVPDFEFLDRESRYLNLINSQYPDSINRTIVVMHSRPNDEQFNNNVALPFDRYLQLFPGMTREEGAPCRSFCLNGHNHHTETLEPFDDGILFYGIANIHKRVYYVITINDDCYEMELVEF